jgi:flagellar basal-body rod protein FlgG
MIRGLYFAASGMLAATDRQNITAQNLANVNTDDFRRLVARQSAISDQSVANTVRGTSIGLLGQGAITVETVLDERPGPLRFTGDQLDVAMTDGLYFAVDTPQGVMYRAGGHLHVDTQGFIADENGYRLAGIPSVEGAGDVKFTRSGEVLDADNQVLGELQVFRAANGAAVEPASGGLYRLAQALPQATDTVLEPGTLRGSNVDVVREMVALIETSRAYESAQKVVQAFDTVLDHAANRIGRL